MIVITAYEVFVYGTLREGEKNHYLIEGSECIARQSWTTGILYDTGNGYPALVPDKQKRVYGEVYRISKEQLKKLDWLEGYKGKGLNNEYERVIQPVNTDHGELDAYLYHYHPSKVTACTEIMYGDWISYNYLTNEEILYFAYGSCMDNERFCFADIDHLFKKIKGCGIVHNYSLFYTRLFHDGARADLRESSGWAEGKVYEINKQALGYLFHREGVNNQIYRPAVIKAEINSKLYNVLTFLVIDKQPEAAPPEHYAVEIIRGASGFVSERYLQHLKKELLEKFGLRMPDL